MTGGPEVGRCWLDPRLVERELRPGLRVAVDTLGLDPALSALAFGAAVVGVVPGPADEEARRALEVAALRELPVQSTRALLGYDAPGRRVWFYHHLRPLLADDARAFWDAREERIRLGIIDQGDRERAWSRIRALPGPVRSVALLRWRLAGGWRAAAAAGRLPGTWAWLDPARYPRGRSIEIADPDTDWDILVTDREPRLRATRIIRGS